MRIYKKDHSYIIHISIYINFAKLTNIQKHQTLLSKKIIRFLFDTKPKNYKLQTYLFFRKMIKKNLNFKI